MSRLAVMLVIAYRHTLGLFVGGRCKYHPSCSQYAIDAFGRHGFLRGLVLAAWRLLRCNPWSEGGVDYVESQRLFRHRRTVSPRAAATPRRTA